MDARANATPVGTVGANQLVTVFRGGEAESVVEVRWESAGGGLATFTVEEAGDAGCLYPRTFQLPPNGARRLRLVGGVSLSVVATVAAGAVHWRILDDVERHPKGGPPVESKFAVIAPAATANAGWCPAWCETVTVYTVVDLVTPAWFDTAGVLTARCPINIEVPHPPGHTLRLTNGDAVNRSALVVWR